MAKELRIEVVGTRKQGKSAKDGKDYNFVSFIAYDNKGKKMDCRFTTECKNAPKSEGTHILRVMSDKCNISKKNKYDTLWIQDVVGEVDSKEIAEKYAKSMEDRFGEDEPAEVDEPLPFE